MAARDAKTVIDAVRAKPKYRHVHADLVRALAKSELAKGRTEKQTIKEVTAKLHQVAGAYFTRVPQYGRWGDWLRSLPRAVSHLETLAFCRQVIATHSSTAERMPILDEFFHTTLASIAPLESILDLACGLNPLALAWMPVTAQTRYYGCDLYADMADFLNGFYEHIGRHGQFEAGNLLQMGKERKPFVGAQVTFLLKSLPCLDQLEKGIGLRLLESTPSPYVLVSFPVASLGGRLKGMRANYESQFLRLIEGKEWEAERFSFQSELAFLVKKND